MYLRNNEGSPRQTGIWVKEPGKVSKANRAAEVGWACFWQAGGYAWKQYWYSSSSVLPGLSMGTLGNTPWAPTRCSEKGWQTIHTPFAEEAAAAEAWESSSASGQAASLTREVRGVNRLPFPQSLRFPKRMNGQSVLWKAEPMGEHCAPPPIPLVIARGENGHPGVRDKEICWNQHLCGERLQRMRALQSYLDLLLFTEWYEHSRCYSFGLC